MFFNWNWREDRTAAQEARLNNWIAETKSFLVIEVGGGTQIPTVRRFGEQLGQPLIRINPTEPELGTAKDVSLRLGALEALRGIDLTLNAPV